VDCNRRRFIPSTEKIFWLSKCDKPYFDRKNDTIHKNEVWRFPCDLKNDHPAPFPIDLPNNIIHCCKREDSRIVVLDPFMGSGTVAASAIQNDCDYIGFEKFEKYVKMINDRIENEKEIVKNKGSKLF
jgi:modification methylase